MQYKEKNMRRKFFISIDTNNTCGTWIKISEKEYNKCIASYKKQADYNETAEDDEQSENSFTINKEIYEYSDRIETYHHIHDGAVISLRKIECKEGYRFKK